MAKGPYTASDGRKYVTVVSGDTLSQIAVDYKSYSNNATYKQLAAINDIDNPNRIAIGQKIYLSKKTGSGGGTSKKKKTVSSNRAKIKQFGLQADVDRTLLATWTWDKKNTENYKVQWQYYTKDKIWFMGNESETTYEYSTYQIPDNATRVRFRVKPISKKYKVKNKKGKETEKSYWTAEWTDRSKQTFNVSADPPEAPSAPNIEINGSKLTARLDNISSNATKIKFEIVKNDAKKAYKTGTATIKTKSASYSCTVDLGGKYKVRCQAIRGNLKSDWSDYSSNAETIPSTPKEIKYIKALSETSVQLDWTNVSNATGYTIEYTTKKMYFDSGASEVKSTTVDAKFAGHAEITGLTSGEKYFFRVKATNSKGDSGWCPIKSIIIGKEPAAPTTWSSTTTAIVGESVTLYWVHNSEDGSSETSVQVELYIGKDKKTYTLGNSKINNDVISYKPRTEDEKDDGVIGSCVIKTTAYTEGTQIKWRVKTKGIINKYGDWSVQRVIDIYAAPSLELSLLAVGPLTYILTTTQPTDWSTNYTSYYIKSDNGYVHVTGDTAPTWTLDTYYSTKSETSPLETLSSFPFYVSGIASPKTQSPVGYHLVVTSNELYDTVDNVGDPKTVSEGEAVYSKYFDTSDDLLVEMSAGNIDLENGITYTVTCTVSMSSGLTAETSAEFTVSWTETEYVPNAEIGIDENTYSASIRPYCEEMSLIYYEVTKSNNTYIKTTNVIENDLFEEELHDKYGKDIATTTGEQVFIGTTDEGTELYFCVVTENNLIEDVTLSVYRREFDGGFTEIGKNLDGGTVVTDPHPALDYARYRIVATDKNTGAVSYYDIPNEPVNGKSVIIQWDEEWSTFAATDSTDAMDEPPWTGSMLTLPYNIDVSDKYGLDVELVEYIGRKHPVSYYGTQRGESSSWSVDIEKDDEETLYNLRRLATYAGDVYVREPSGSGYWANVTVSFSQTHCELTIPVTLGITRVEGGI